MAHHDLSRSSGVIVLSLHPVSVMLRTLRLVLLSGGSLLAFATLGADDGGHAEPIYVQSYAPGGYGGAPTMQATSGLRDAGDEPLRQTTHALDDATTSDKDGTDAENPDPRAYDEATNVADL